VTSEVLSSNRAVPRYSGVASSQTLEEGCAQNMTRTPTRRENLTRTRGGTDSCPPQVRYVSFQSQRKNFGLESSTWKNQYNNKTRYKTVF
jgi:hypothetical protein